MNFNKLTVKAQEAVGEAQNLARGAGNPEVTPARIEGLLQSHSGRTRSSRERHAAKGATGPRDLRDRRARLDQIIALAASPPLSPEPPIKRPLHLIWGAPSPRSDA